MPMAINTNATIFLKTFSKDFTLLKLLLIFEAEYAIIQVNINAGIPVAMAKTIGK